MGNALWRRSVSSALLFVALAALPGCGALGLALPLLDDIDFGGDDDDDTDAVSLASDPELDGWVDSEGDFDASSDPITGDRDDVQPGVGNRQLFSFELTGVPIGATIVSAELRLFQVSTNGDPYGELGVVVVDHVDYGPALDGSDYDGGTLFLDLGELSVDSTSESKVLDVTAAVQDDVDLARFRSQFRIRFDGADSNDDGTPDHAVFGDAEADVSTHRPVLVVVFES